MDIFTLGLKADTRDLKRGEEDLKGFAKTGADTEKRVNRSFQEMAKAAKVAMAAVSAVAVVEFTRAIKVTMEFDAAISNLSAITGAAGEDLEFYRQASKELGVQSTLTATQVAEAFKLIASAKPDLLESAEALKEVTAQAITLSEAAGITVPEAANALGNSLNQFGADASEAGRFINVLAAGAKFGASAITDTTLALKVAGTSAAAAGVSFEEINAQIQALAAVGTKGAEAGTALRNVILRLSQGADETNPEIVGLTTALQTLGEQELSTTELTKLFGLENVNAARALIDAADATETLTQKLTGTDEAFVQAQKNTDNLKGDVDRLKSAYEGLQIQIGESATSGVRGSVQGLTEVLNDPATAEGLENLVTAVTTIAKWGIQASTAMADFATAVGEMAAVFSMGDWLEKSTTLTLLLNPATVGIGIKRLREQREEQSAYNETLGGTVSAISILNPALDEHINYLVTGEGAMGDLNDATEFSVVPLSAFNKQASIAAENTEELTENAKQAAQSTTVWGHEVANLATEYDNAMGSMIDATGVFGDAFESVWADVRQSILNDFDNLGDALIDSVKRTVAGMALEAGKNSFLSFFSGNMDPTQIERGLEFLGNSLMDIGEDMGWEIADEAGGALLNNAQMIGQNIGIAAAAAIGAVKLGEFFGERIPGVGGDLGGIGAAANIGLLPILGTLAIPDLLGDIGSALFGGDKEIRGRDVLAGFTAGGADAAIRTTIRESGGTFGGGPDYSRPIEQAGELADQLNNAFAPALDVARNATDLFGGSLSDFSVDLETSIHGLSDEEASAALAGMVGEAMDALAVEVAPWISGFQQGNETLIQTLDRVTGQTNTVVGVFESLGTTLDVPMLEGSAARLWDMGAAINGMPTAAQINAERLAAMTQAMIDAAGGMGSFLEGFALFRKEFLSAEENLAMDTARLEELIGVIPESRDAFTQLVRDGIIPMNPEILALADTFYDAAEAAIEFDNNKGAFVDAIDDVSKAMLEAAFQFDVALGFVDPFGDALAALGLTMAGLEQAAQGGQEGLRAYLSELDTAGRASLAPFTGDILGLIPQTGSSAARSVSRVSSARSSGSGTDWAAIASDLREFARGARTTLLEPVQNLANAKMDFFRTANAARKRDEDAARELAAKGQDVIDLALQTARTEVEFNRIVATVTSATEGVADVLSPEQQQVELLKDQLDTLRAIQFELQSAPGFADGGVVSGPQTGFTAKLHGTELVVSQNRSVPVTVQNGGNERLEARLQNIESSLFQIAKFNMKSNRVLERWDGDGLPEERDVS
jgi:TP901 family phage tail tape measure protein